MTVIEGIDEDLGSRALLLGSPAGTTGRERPISRIERRTGRPPTATVDAARPERRGARVERRQRARRRRRTGRTLLGYAATVMFLAVAFMFWPASLGGEVSYIKVSGESMLPHFHLGDLVVMREADTYRVGDVIAYRVPDGDVGGGLVVVHRIVGGDAQHGFVTRGDNREFDDSWHPKPSDIVGREWFSLSGLGTKMGALRTPSAFAFFGGVVVMLGTYAALTPKPRTRRRGDRRSGSDRRATAGSGGRRGSGVGRGADETGPRGDGDGLELGVGAELPDHALGVVPDGVPAHEERVADRVG